MGKIAKRVLGYFGKGGIDKDKIEELKKSWEKWSKKICLDSSVLIGLLSGDERVKRSSLASYSLIENI